MFFTLLWIYLMVGAVIDTMYVFERYDFDLEEVVEASPVAVVLLWPMFMCYPEDDDNNFGGVQ